ncbi:MAG: vancomycin high temperature exclusion protein [Saprospiraceae bacterium]
MKLLIKIFGWGIFLILFGILTVFLLNFWVVQSTDNQIVENISQVENNQVGLVLGTTPRLRRGYANPYFTHRINAAVDLYQKGKVRHLILSGDNSKKEYNEPQEMLDALVKKGIPIEKMTLDYAGFRTLDSVVRSKAVFQQDKILIISQGFHTPRALFIANRFDIAATAYNAKQVYRTRWSKVKTREYIARCLAVLDLYILGREPKFYGKKINIE